jgi:hypothetical protein
VRLFSTASFCLHHLNCVKMAAFQLYLQSKKQRNVVWGGKPDMWHLYPQKQALSSPISNGRSVGIVRSRTQATEFVRERSPQNVREVGFANVPQCVSPQWAHPLPCLMKCLSAHETTKPEPAVGGASDVNSLTPHAYDDQHVRM